MFFKFFFRGVGFSCVCCWNVVFFMNVVSVVFFCGLLGFRGYFVFFHRSSWVCSFLLGFRQYFVFFDGLVFIVFCLYGFGLVLLGLLGISWVFMGFRGFGGFSCLFVLVVFRCYRCCCCYCAAAAVVEEILLYPFLCGVLSALCGLRPPALKKYSWETVLLRRQHPRTVVKKSFLFPQVCEAQQPGAGSRPAKR